jgi:radical SAM family uncharacterized protein/radical SAM-linked protein
VTWSPAALRAKYEDLLPLVEKPARYLGGERGSYSTDAVGRLRIALAFPDVYEIGQSHLGLQILYDLLNRTDGVVAERVYAPWLDMERLLRQHGLPLATLETCTPLGAFDIVGLSLQYELTYTNLVTMLELGGIPIRSEAREPRHPLVIAGGPGAFNPEPIADFIDAFVLGDGEEAILDVCEVYRAWTRRDRLSLLEALRRVPGVYVPAFFRPRHHADGTLAAIDALRPDYGVVEKRVLRDLNDSPVPRRPVVPNIDIVHERPSVEVMRGCVKGCRFCQAGYVYRPQRERDPRRVVAEGIRLIEETGYDELSLLSLSTGDYSCINPVLRDLMNRFASRDVGVSLPSTRVDAISPQVVEELGRARKTGFTLAPEAGSQRMRDIIQKEYREEELVEAARLIFGLGWRSLKLYFMLGLPGETDADLVAIADLCGKVAAACPGRAEITASVSTFVPKPHTPFQWAAQIDMAETHARQELLRRELGRRRIRFKWHDARLSYLEGIFSRGDRRLGRLVLAAQRLGCRFDGWTDQCRWDLWERAIAATGVDASFYLRRRPLGEVLPWDHLYAGVTKKYLQQELARAVEGRLTPDCSIERCTYCGACDFKTVRNVSYHLRGAKGGRHLGADIDDWARTRLPEVDTWETRSWQVAQAHLADRAGRAARARGVVPGESAALEPAALAPANGNGAAAGAPARGEGNAEEWLGARAEAPAGNGGGPRSSRASSPAAAIRMRVRYAKRGPARFIGSRELAEVFYRVVRRASLPVAFSAGYHPLPRLSFGPGLPLGLASDSEFLDLDLTAHVAPDVLIRALDGQLPDGMRIEAAAPLLPGAPGIGAAIAAFRYRVEVPASVCAGETLAARVAAFEAAASFPVLKRGKGGAVRAVDVRPTTTLALFPPHGLEVTARVTAGATPAVHAVVAAALGLDDGEARRLAITKVDTLFAKGDGAQAGSGRVPSPRA